jgi:hypothetical protein
MASSTEVSSFDLRYDTYRMKNPAIEARLLACISERGILEPLQGVGAGTHPILLDGFKRYRCARKLGIGAVPYASLADDEATGLLAVLRASNHNTLTLLEQARFLDDLHTRHHLSPAEIAVTLSRSKAWVSLRLGLLGEMTETVRERLFAGAFPVYAYMYSLRPFMRINGDRKQDVADFVAAVSGKNLSIREIQHLADGYFRGDNRFREQVDSGHLALLLERRNGLAENADGCNEPERALLGDLEVLQKYLRRAIGKSEDGRLQTPAFCAQANLLTAGILGRVDLFTTMMRKLHDRTGPAQGRLPAPRGGHEHPRDLPAPAPQPDCDPLDPCRAGRHAGVGPEGQDPDRA